MSSSRQARIEALFHAARHMPRGEQRAWLEAAAGDDPSVVKEVMSLLDNEQWPAAWPNIACDPALGKDDVFHNAVTLQREVDDESGGQLIGRYKLLQKIGEGGFGTVWMAEQREPVKRRVALKIIKKGMDSKMVIARFEAERQALSMMDHPNIAKVFDAGSTERGRPYFVMEYIRGDPILQYCDTARLDTRARLALFGSVCQAIHHAHQKGIIHRDIKPGNVLVTMHDGVPVPKVIDFGIAKALNVELTERTLFTLDKQMIGTPTYMSPEQAERSELDIDTRSDIYSLGVMLYELLTGTTPFSIQELMGAGFAGMARMIREVDPPKPSTRLSSLGEAAAPTAQQRQLSDIKTLGLMIRGDLDWIVMKCLEKDRTRRYEAASDLQKDVLRHLSGEPVHAAPPSVAYMCSKFVRRHRVLVLTASAILLTAGIGFVGTATQFVHAKNARALAEAKSVEALEQKGRAEANAAESLAQKNRAEGFASNLWSQSVSLINAIHEKALPIAGGLEVRQLLVETALPQLETLAKDRSLSPKERFELSTAYAKLGKSHADKRSANEGNIASARALHEKALVLRERVAQDEPATAAYQIGLADSLISLADLDQLADALDKAVAGYEHAITILKPTLSDEENGNAAAQRLLTAEDSLAECRERLGLPVDPTHITRQLAQRRELVAKNPSASNRRMLSAGLVNACSNSLSEGRAEEALRYAAEAVAIRRELLAAAKDQARANHDLAQALLSVSNAQLELSKPGDAAAAAKEARQIMDSLRQLEAGTADVRHRRTLADCARLQAIAALANKDYPAAEREAAFAAGLFAAHLENSPQDVSVRRRHTSALLTLGRARLAQGNASAAVEPLTQAHASATILTGTTSRATSDSVTVGRVCELLGDAEAAIAWPDRSLPPVDANQLERARNWYRDAIDALGKDLTSESDKRVVADKLDSLKQ